MLKSIANAFHAAVKFVLHIILIPVIALLKAIITVATHLHDELVKV